MRTSLSPNSGVVRLLDQYSMEITAKEAAALDEAKALLAPGTQISVAFLANEDFVGRVSAAKAVNARGFKPMAHIAARRLRSERELAQYLEHLSCEAGSDRVFVIAGDPSEPMGPYGDALSVIRTGLLAKHGVKTVGIAGYPDGHPVIPLQQLRRALLDKVALLAELGHDVEIITQFGFDPDPVLAWLQQLRQDGVRAPVRIGVPGPTNATSLIRMAARLGVSATGSVVAKYGLSLTKLLGVTGPDTFLDVLAARLRPEVHGEVRLHFYTFGSIQRASSWVANYTALAA